MPDLSEAAEKLPEVMSLEVRGMYGYANVMGRSVCGRLILGWDQPYAGIYRRKHTLLGLITERLPLYGPKNPRTVAQQAWRTVFADGRIHWAGLTSGEKAAYNQRARGSRMTGFNLHMREYLAAHKL